MKKRYLKQLLVGFVTVFSLITLIACGSQEKKMSFQRIDQNLQYDLRLTYYYKGDIVTKQTTNSFWSYKTLGATKKEDVKDKIDKASQISKELKKKLLMKRTELKKLWKLTLTKWILIN